MIMGGFDRRYQVEYGGGLPRVKPGQSHDLRLQDKDSCDDSTDFCYRDCNLIDPNAECPVLNGIVWHKVDPNGVI